MLQRFFWIFLSMQVLPCYALGNEQAGQVKSTVCAACHGEKGISLNPLWPNLAGQHARYLMKQLRDYKAGSSRQAPLMMPFAAGLSDDDMADLAAFYAKQPRMPAVSPESFSDRVRGEELYRVGDVKLKITACIACHGPKGVGNDEAGFPVLVGQHADYALAQLRAFKTSTRSNDANAIMRTISSRMSVADMRAVVHYLAQLR